MNVPHHDGSELYVSNGAPRIGDNVTFSVRVPKNYRFDTALIRYYADGEPRTATLKQSKKRKHETWYSVKIKIVNPRTRYRFLFSGKDRYDWLAADGLHEHDVHSNSDFQLLAQPRCTLKTGQCLSNKKCHHTQ